MPAPRLTDVAGVAEYLGRTETAIRRMVERGSIPVVRLDGRVQFDLRKIDRWIDANTEAVAS